ncbi:MAG: phage holin family protein [Nocardioidaceae bacterium]
MSSTYEPERAGGERAESDSEDRSLGSLVSSLSGDMSKLMRQELTLAKAELREEAKEAGKAAGMLGGAAFAGWMTAIFLSVTLMWLLWKAMDLTLAALVVALLWGVAAAVLGLAGKKKLQGLNPKPEQTIDSLKEDAQWLKAQKN